MSAKSTMEELRDLNVRRQREAQQAEQPSIIVAPHNENDQMIKLSNDNSFTQSHEVLSEDANAHSIKPIHKEKLVSVKEASPKHPGKTKGRTGQKLALTATDRLFAQVSREPIMRLNIELTENLHTQLKQYCVQHKVPIRMLVTALIEDFFAKETEGE